LVALKEILTLLIDEKPLPASCKPHPLHGEYSGYMDCHVKFDLILIYRIEGSILWLYRIGSHSDLFK
jgi:mRNA interferase YafQ